MDAKKIETEIKNSIGELLNTIRGMFYTREASYSIVRYMFLKYVLDNFLYFAKSNEEIKDFSMAQKVISARDVEGGPNGIWPVLYNLDRLYNLDGVLKRAIDDYANDLFGENTSSWTKKNTSKSEYVRVMDIIASINLEEEEEGSFTLGKILVRQLIEILNEMAFYNGFKGADQSSSQSIIKLASKILNIQNNETFVDFTSGIGLSTLGIVENKSVKVYNCDINVEATSIAAMLYIMNGYSDFKVVNEDSLKVDVSMPKADKIFIDAPWGVRVEALDQKRDSIDVVIEKTLELLNDRGRAVIAVPSSYLFKSLLGNQHSKKVIVDNGYIEAVIALPALKLGTTVPVNLIVLSKISIHKTLLINASVSFSEKQNRRDVLTKEGIEKIISIYKNEEIVAGVSEMVNNEQFIKKDYNLSPQLYLDIAVEEDNTTLQDVDKQLKELYDKLKDNLFGD